MNKIIIFLILTSLAFPAYVTFNVDMSAEDIEEEPVYLWMGFYWPEPGFTMEASAVPSGHSPNEVRSRVKSPPNRLKP